MEIQLKDNSTVKKSSKTFDVSSLEFDVNVVIAIHLDELESMNLYQNALIWRLKQLLLVNRSDSLVVLPSRR
jgi:hypothetical protein